MPCSNLCWLCVAYVHILSVKAILTKAKLFGKSVVCGGVFGKCPQDVTVAFKIVAISHAFSSACSKCL